MNPYRYTRIVVKVGSRVLSCEDGTLDVLRMAALAEQIAALHKAGMEIILVSSGAVAAGRSEVKPVRKLDSVEQRQLFSAVGQVRLISRYGELFRKYGIAVGQVLAMKESFATRRHYLNQRNCMRAMLDNGVLPVVNENDTVSVTELMFTDNDELSGLVASMMDAQALVILSDIDGILAGSPWNTASQVIREVGPNYDVGKYIQAGQSGFGRGGMLTKSRIARKVAGEGIAVFIANGKRERILLDLMECPEETLCTRFLPAPAGISGVKKWIAHSEGFAKGAVWLNGDMTEVLRGNRAASILPVGVVRVEGAFERGDIVRVMDAAGRQIGIGKAGIGSVQAAGLVGQHGKRPVVHYDYLYLEEC